MVLVLTMALASRNLAVLLSKHQNLAVDLLPLLGTIHHRTVVAIGGLAELQHADSQTNLVMSLHGGFDHLIICILAEDVVVGAGAKIGGDGAIAHVGTGLTVGAGATVKEGAKVFDSVKEGEEVC